MPDFDVTAGHISIAHGAMPLTDIDWRSLCCAPDENLEEMLGHHFLSAIETPDVRLKVGIYLVQGNLKLHTDIVEPGKSTLGMILAADGDLELTTGRNRVRASPGDVFRLCPDKRHGAWTNGILAFAAQDYWPLEMPKPGAFRTATIAEFRKLLDARAVHYSA